MKRTLFMMIIVASLSYGIQAAMCVSGTLASYDALGFSCNIDGVVFSNFSYNPTGIAPPDTGVTVNPIDMSPTNVGLEFVSGWGASNGQFEDSLIKYKATCDQCQIEDLELTMAGSTALGTGFVVVGETAPTPVIGLGVGEAVGFIKLTDSTTFLPVHSLDLSKDILVRGGGDGIAQVSSVTNLLSLTGGPPVPEPSLLLLCLGLCAVVPVARRRLGRMNRQSS